MFQLSNFPEPDPEIAEQSTSESYNWQKWTKWGLLSAGGLVLTTATLYYGGSTLVAGLTALAAGVASRFKESSQGTALSQIEQNTDLGYSSPFSAPTQPNIVLNGFQAAEERNKELTQSIEAYSETEEWKKFKEELEITEDDSAEDDGDEHIPELLSPAVAQGKRVERLKSAEFDVFPSVLQHKREMSTIPTDSLIAYYSFNGNANDESGHENNGTLYGEPTLAADRFGNPDRAYDFDGVEDYILVDGGFNLANNSFSLGAWVRKRSTGGYYIFSQGPALYSHELLLEFLDDNVFRCGFYNDDLYLVAYTDTDWHHWACTFNVSTKSRKIYRDGVEVASDQASENYQGSGAFYIGRTSRLDTHFFDGSMDQIVIYDRELSLSEIQTLSYWLHDLNRGLVAYYPFNGNANDESGNENHGGLHNGPTLVSDRFGNSDSAYYFNGINQYIYVVSDDDLDLLTSLSLSAWVKHQSNLATVSCVIGKGRDVAKSGYALRKNSLGFNNNRYNCGSGSTDVFRDDWHHIIGTWDGYTINFYVNGELIDNNTGCATSPLLKSSQPLHIGREVHLLDRFFRGTIDDVSIYNRSLTLEEIQTLYHMNYWPLGVSNTHQLISYVEDDAQIKLDKMKVIAAELNVSLNLVLSDQNAGILGTTVTNSTVTPTFINGIWNAMGAPIEINRLLTGLFFGYYSPIFFQKA